jgi:hypothetical protein
MVLYRSVAKKCGQLWRNLSGDVHHCGYIKKKRIININKYLKRKKRLFHAGAVLCMAGSIAKDELKQILIKQSSGHYI